MILIDTHLFLVICVKQTELNIVYLAYMLIVCDLYHYHGTQFYLKLCNCQFQVNKWRLLKLLKWFYYHPFAKLSNIKLIDKCVKNIKKNFKVFGNFIKNNKLSSILINNENNDLITKYFWNSNQIQNIINLIIASIKMNFQNKNSYKPLK